MTKLLPYLILLSALLVSGSAAFYSVYGLSELFAGASNEVIIMASSLEFSKIIIATALHRYWNRFNLLIKTYLVSAVVVLVIITSGGIYGFLSNAYEITASKNSIHESQLKLIETKRDRYIQTKDELVIEKNQIVDNLTDLRSSMNNNVVQKIDRKSGKILNSISDTNRKSIDKQLDDASARRDVVSGKIDVLSDSITNSDIAIVQLESSSSVSAELGPLKYISRLTGYSMDIIVNGFLILLMFVFDPLAIVLVLAANITFQKEIDVDNPIVNKKSGGLELLPISPNLVSRPSFVPPSFVNTPPTPSVSTPPPDISTPPPDISTPPDAVSDAVSDAVVPDTPSQMPSTDISQETDAIVPETESIPVETPHPSRIIIDEDAPSDIKDKLTLPWLEDKKK